MTKEKIKTALLSVLILSSVILSFQIWTSEKLWPEGYDFFSVYPKNFISRIFGKNPEQSVNINVTGALDSVFSPRTVMLSFNDGRISYNGFQGQGVEAVEKINGILTAAFSGEIEKTTETEWQNALKEQNIYANYNVPIGFKEFSSFMGINKTSSEDRFFDSITISRSDSQNSVPVYFRNSTDNLYYKTSAKYNKSAVDNLFVSLSNRPMLNLSYAYELNLDKKLTGEAQNYQKILIESYVLLPLDEIVMPEIVPVIPNLREENYVKGIINSLGFNAGTSQKFTQTDSTDVYINSNAEISITSDGYLEYNAPSGATGIQVATSDDFSGIVAGSADIIDKILYVFNPSEATRLFINSPLISNGNEDNTLYFDYIYDGYPIDMGEDKHGCIVTTKGGKITSIKMYIRDFKKVSSGKSENSLSVIDKLYSMLNGEDIHIKELYCGYLYDDTKMHLNWFAKVDGNDAIIRVE